MKIAAFLPELLRHLFKKPATVDYPFKKLPVPKGFRGTPYLKPEICIACRACERDCPAEKKFRMVIHNDRCVHCAQCVDVCPTGAMQIDAEFEISGGSRRALKAAWDFIRAVVKPKAAPPKPAAPAKPAGETAPSDQAPVAKVIKPEPA